MMRFERQKILQTLCCGLVRLVRTRIPTVSGMIGGIRRLRSGTAGCFVLNAELGIVDEA